MDECKGATKWDFNFDPIKEMKSYECYVVTRLTLLTLLLFLYMYSSTYVGHDRLPLIKLCTLVMYD